MFPVGQATVVQPLQIDHIHMTKAKLKEAAKKKSEQVKAQAEQIYQTYSAKNWFDASKNSIFCFFSQQS